MIAFQIAGAIIATLIAIAALGILGYMAFLFIGVKFVEMFIKGNFPHSGV